MIPAFVPLRFGKASRQLFGLYQPPSGGDDRGHAVLLCNPFGQEAIRCHRLLRVLGDRLAREGFHILRFDYFGTGDADGDDADVTLEGWQSDVLVASEELVRQSRCASVSWFGARLGATAAAFASSRSPRPLQRLLLWEPILDGAAYLQQLEAAHDDCIRHEFVTPERRAHAAVAASGTEILGFPVSAAMRAQIGALSPAAVAMLGAAGIHLLSAEAPESAAGFEASLRQRNLPFHFHPLQSKVLWASNEAMNSAIVPADAVNAVIACLRGDA